MSRLEGRAGMPQAQETCLPPQLSQREAHAGPGEPDTQQPQVQQSLIPIPSRVGDLPTSSLVLEFVRLRFLLLFHEVGGELGYSVFQQLLLLGCEVDQSLVH